VKQEEPQIDLTPMLDVTFIMLIFFIVTAQFVKEPGIKVTRPTAETGQGLKPTILIAISEKNEVWINKRAVDPREVKANVQQMLEENPLAQVVLQVDREAENGTLVETMNALQSAGVIAINVATEQN
jgi:biopolymer transport protein ExbD